MNKYSKKQHNNNMKNFTKIVAAALIGSSACLSVSAIPLIGSVSMSTTPGSSWTGDGGTVNTIASILNFGVSQVDSTTGSFVALVPLSSVVIWGQPFAFGAPAGSNPLWTTPPGPGAVTFDLAAAGFAVNRIDRAFPQPDTLTLSGVGTVTAPGFDPTPGGWEWSGTMSGSSTFSFRSTTIVAPPPPPPVPDGGSTLALLGVALGGIALLGRRLA
jgi:hypothetical protein